MGFKIFDYDWETPAKEYEKLKREYEELMKDSRYIEDLNLSESTTQKVLSELSERKTEIKKKLHECIDKM